MKLEIIEAREQYEDARQKLSEYEFKTRWALHEAGMAYAASCRIANNAVNPKPSDLQDFADVCAKVIERLPQIHGYLLLFLERLENTKNYSEEEESKEHALAASERIYGLALGIVTAFEEIRAKTMPQTRDLEFAEEKYAKANAILEEMRAKRDKARRELEEAKRRLDEIEE